MLADTVAFAVTQVFDLALDGVERADVAQGHLRRAGFAFRLAGGRCGAHGVDELTSGMVPAADAGDGVVTAHPGIVE